MKTPPRANGTAFNFSGPGEGAPGIALAKHRPDRFEADWLHQIASLVE